MALLGGDDDFFGDSDDESNEFISGLGAAEASSQNEIHRKLGFHEAYEKSETEFLQRGFEKGYEESFSIAKNIGEQLGALTMARLLPLTGEERRTQGRDHVTLLGSEDRPPYIVAAQEIRSVLTSTTTTTTATPQDLESLHLKISSISDQAGTT